MPKISFRQVRQIRGGDFDGLEFRPPLRNRQVRRVPLPTVGEGDEERSVDESDLREFTGQQVIVGNILTPEEHDRWAQRTRDSIDILSDEIQIIYVYVDPLEAATDNGDALGSEPVASI